MSVPRYDITITKGATYRERFQFVDGAGAPLDLSDINQDWCSISARPGDGVHVATLTVSVPNGGADGVVELELDDQATAALPLNGPLYWDLFLQLVDANGDITPMVAGQVRVRPAVSL